MNHLHGYRARAERSKSNVTIISQMRRTIFQQLKVLINHKINYIVSLWHLFKLSICWIGTPINIRSVIKWWLRFDVINGSCFFSAWNLYHICHITDSFSRRMMHVEDVRPPNEKSHAYHLSITSNWCEFCLLTPPAILALPKCPFKGWRL